MQKKKKKTQITPQKEITNINETNLSEQLTKLFPKLDEVTNEKKEDKKYEEEIENITEILSKIDSKKVPFEFEFFSGGKNKKFDKVMRSIGLSSDNIDFLDFLQSNICKRILISNKLKINIETGNIYYNDQDKNELIFDAFYKQQNST